MSKLTFLQEETLRIVKGIKKRNPITAGRLAFSIRLKENPTKEGANMRSIIHALRVKGYPICANGRGYYYAENSLELSEYIAALIGKIVKMQEACDGLGRSYDMVKEVFDEKTTFLF